MTIDERLAAYVREQWAVVVDYAAQLCPDGDDAEAQELALAALTRVAVRWRNPADSDLGATVRQALIQTCARRRNRPHGGGAQDYQLMDVGFAGHPAEPAVVEPPSPQLDPADALAELTRRFRRGRRTRLAAACAAVAVCGVAATVALTGSNSGPPPERIVRFGAAGPLAFPRIAFDFAGGVTAGGGYIWSIENHPTKPGSRSYVVERDPVTGRVDGRYRVPSADDQIAYGLGKVWIWRNVNDTATTTIATVDPVGDVDTERTTPDFAISDVAFTNRAAWLTEPGRGSVVKVRNGVLGAETGSRLPDARYVVPMSTSSVLVAGRSGSLHLMPGNHAVESATPTLLTLLAAAPSYGFWIGQNDQLTYQSGITAAPSLTLTLPLKVAAVLGDPAHGVYVATQSDDPVHHDPYLVYYSPAALKAAVPRPTARLDGLAQAESMVADPAGGVVFATNEGAVERWDPVNPRSFLLSPNGATSGAASGVASGLAALR